MALKKATRPHKTSCNRRQATGHSGEDRGAIELVNVIRAMLDRLLKTGNAREEHFFEINAEQISRTIL